jgi:hypothetical protein
MATISITITPSSAEILPGIPQSVAIATNIPSVIFYTLNGQSPNEYSPVYSVPINLPGLSNITLSIFATDGVDTSTVITQTYTLIPSEVITMAGDRLPHAAVPFDRCQDGSNNFPFGSNYPHQTTYLNTALAGTTVADPSTPTAYFQGYNADGYPTSFSNQPQTYYQFNTLYSTTDVEGNVFPGVGSLPARTTIRGSPYDIEYRPEFSSTADKIFNPKAMVIYDDGENADPTNPVIIGRQNFSLESPEIVRDGNLLFNQGLDAPPTMGGFVNRTYNARDNTMTNSYYDNTVNRWVFSTQPYAPTTAGVGQLGMVIPAGRGQGNGFVFQWHWGLYRTLV